MKTDFEIEILNDVVYSVNNGHEEEASTDAIIPSDIPSIRLPTRKEVKIPSLPMNMLGSFLPKKITRKLISENSLYYTTRELQ